MVVSQHRASHQGLPDGGDTSRKHEEQRSDAKVRYRLADLQPRTCASEEGGQITSGLNTARRKVLSLIIPASVTLKKNVIVITVSQKIGG